MMKLLSKIVAYRALTSESTNQQDERYDCRSAFWIKAGKFDCLTLPNCDKGKSSANVADAIF
jgi:hypothetical protein